MKSSNAIALLCSIALTGCASSSLTPSHGNRISAGQAGTVLAGTAAGAAVGNEIGGTKGAVIGGAVGAIGTVVAYNAYTDQKNAEIEKAKEQARREERVRIMKEWWKQHAIDAQNEGEPKPSTPTTTKQPTVTYPAGSYDGVDYVTRQVTGSQ